MQYSLSDLTKAANDQDECDSCYDIRCTLQSTKDACLTAYQAKTADPCIMDKAYEILSLLDMLISIAHAGITSPWSTRGFIKIAIDDMVESIVQSAFKC